MIFSVLPRSIVKITLDEVYFILDGQEGSGKIFKLFHTDRYAKTAIIWFVAIPTSRLLVKFLLNILTIQALATLQTLLQS